MDRELFEGCALFFPGGKFLYRERDLIFLRDSLAKQKKAIRLGIRRTHNKERIYDREHESRAANPESENERDRE